MDQRVVELPWPHKWLVLEFLLVPHEFVVNQLELLDPVIPVLVLP